MHPTAPTLSAPTSRTRIADAVVALLAGVYSLVATFPALTYPGSGLDSSWRLEINRLYVERLFGRDAAFTYGPLGHLLEPADNLGAVLGASALRFTLQAALAAVVASLCFRGRRLAAAVVVAAWMVAIWSGLAVEDSLLLLLPVLALEAVRRGRTGWLLLGGALAGAAVYVKTSLAVGALGVGLSAGLLLIGRYRLRATRLLSGCALAYVAVVLALAPALLRSRGDLVPWLRLSAWMASGYSVAMSLPGPARELWAACAAALLATTLGSWLLWRRSPAGGAALLFAVPAFIVFKHAFVRQDGYHAFAFLPFLLVALSLALVWARGPREVTAVAAVLAVTALGTAVLARPAAAFPLPTIGEVASGSWGFRNLRAWADAPGQVRRLRVEVAASMAGDAIPGLSERVGSASVGVLPWQLSSCRANALHCIPSPTLQLYAAYTAELDRRTADHYAGAGAPDFILIQDQAIDGRSVLLDTPATLLTLLSRYQLASGPQTFDRLLLRRRGDPLHLQGSEVLLGEAEAAPWRWISVPEAPGLVVARAEFELSLRGWLEKVLFRVAPVWMDVVTCDGQTTSHRIMPDTARNGLLLGAAGEGGLESVFQRRTTKQVVRVRWRGAGLRAYRRPIRIAFSALPAETGPLACSPPQKPGSLARREAPGGAPMLAIDDLVAESYGADGGTLRIKGWAVDPSVARPASGVLVEVDGHEAWFPTGRRRDDVASVLHEPAYGTSGFVGVMPLDGLRPGRQQVVLRVVTEDRRGYYDGQRREIVVR